MNPFGAFRPTLRRHGGRWPLVALGFVFGGHLGAQDGSPPQRYPSDGGFGNPSSNPLSIRPVVICFPPLPPPIDRPISHAVSPMPPRLTPPAELASYINEPFYAPLSTWLIEKTLSEKMRQRLTALHLAKENALGELRAALEQVRDADAATRRRTLTALARQQTPTLAALERDAEQIRSALATGDYDWRSLREWALGERNVRGDSPMEIAATMRAYAYYQSGLADGQRRLLREISMELAAAGEDTVTATAAQPFFFFSPEPARVLLPDDLPADLAAKVTAYQTRKSALKKELYDAVYKADGLTISFFRNSALRSLADKQAARLAALEQLAEDIRVGLAGLPSATRPPADRSTLPPVLTARLGNAIRAGTALQKETIEKVGNVRASIQDEPIRLSYNFDSTGLKFTVAPRVMGAASPADIKAEFEKLQPRMREIEIMMAAIADDFGRRYAALINESNAIRADAAAALGNPDARTVETALATARRLLDLRESEDAYREYRLAVFEPGLSPEQRRLLFGGAIEKLDLPLLRGEFQPVQRAAGW